MATYKGREGSMTFGAGLVVSELRSFELETTANLVDASRMGDAWTREDSTQNSYSGSCSCFWDPADVGQAAATVGSRVAFEMFPRGDTTTMRVYSGTATIEAVSLKQAHDGLVEAEIKFKGYGTLVIGTVA